jgi:hypothetical protein
LQIALDFPRFEEASLRIAGIVATVFALHFCDSDGEIARDARRSRVFSAKKVLITNSK